MSSRTARTLMCLLLLIRAACSVSSLAFSGAWRDAFGQSHDLDNAPQALQNDGHFLGWNGLPQTPVQRLTGFNELLLQPAALGRQVDAARSPVAFMGRASNQAPLLQQPLDGRDGVGVGKGSLNEIGILLPSASIRRRTQ